MLSIPCSFWEILENRILAPPPGSSGNPGSATVHGDDMKVILCFKVTTQNVPDL